MKLPILAIIKSDILDDNGYKFKTIRETADINYDIWCVNKNLPLKPLIRSKHFNRVHEIMEIEL